MPMVQDLLIPRMLIEMPTALSEVLLRGSVPKKHHYETGMVRRGRAVRSAIFPFSPPALPSLCETCTYRPGGSCTSACMSCSTSRGARKCRYAGRTSPWPRLSGHRNDERFRVRPSGRGRASVRRVRGKECSSSSGTLMLTSSWWEWRIEVWRLVEDWGVKSRAL